MELAWGLPSWGPWGCECLRWPSICPSLKCGHDQDSLGCGTVSGLSERLGMQTDNLRGCSAGHRTPDTCRTQTGPREGEVPAASPPSSLSRAGRSEALPSPRLGVPHWVVPGHQPWRVPLARHLVFPFQPLPGWLAALPASSYLPQAIRAAPVYPAAAEETAQCRDRQEQPLVMGGNWKLLEHCRSIWGETQAW